MRRLIFIFAAAMMVVNVIAEENQNSVKLVTKSSITKTDSLLQVIKEWTEQIEIDLSIKHRHKLYPTQNMYNFLLLDTKTGMIDQVQWSLERKKEWTTVINGKDLTYGYGYGSGSFELYPTQSMYEFILLDKTQGRVWHVQWGLNDQERWIRQIY